MSKLFYTGVGVDVAFQEKRAWIMGVVAILGYAVYLAVVLARSGGGVPLAEVAYIAPLLWTVGGAIAVSIALNIAVAIASPGEADAKDQRDKEIARLGDYTGQSFLVIAAVAALALAMAEADYFWISNAIYLGFVLSAVLGSAVKLAAYRRGSSRGEADRHHEPDPRAALRARGDDPGRPGRTHRRDPSDRDRHREGPLLALPRNGVQDRPRLRGAA